MFQNNLYIPGLETGVKPRTRKSERLFSLVPMFAKGKFYWRPQDIEGQQEFLSYPKGKHDDIMDAIWTALDGAKPCRLKKFEKLSEEENVEILTAGLGVAEEREEVIRAGNGIQYLVNAAGVILLKNIWMTLGLTGVMI